MDAVEYWKLFLETGRPEIYVMYTQALKAEGAHVSEDNCAGIKNQRI